MADRVGKKASYVSPYIFAVPGEENLDMVESLRNSSIKLIICRHEQAAVFMAATVGRLTGRVGVCMSTLGPGATNLVTGMAYANLCGFPTMAITGQKAIRDNWQGAFQLVDVVGMMKPLTKSAVSIISPDKVATIVHDAVKLAEEHRPGAVHIELPEDIAGDETSASIQKHSSHTHAEPNAASLKQAAELILKSTRPFIIVSGGAQKSGIHETLTGFCDALKIPVVHTQMGKGVLADDTPCSLQTTGIHKKDYVHCGLHRSDCIITIGYDVAEHPPSVWNPEKDKTIIHIDKSSARSDEWYNPTCEVIGDISHALTSLQDLLKGYSANEEEAAKLKDFLLGHINDKNDADALIPQRIVADVRTVMGREDVISLDNGIYKVWFARNYPAYGPNTVLLDNCLATMGAGLPVAMATKMIHPEKNVLAICGDGGFMMNSQEVETAVRLGLDLTILLLNDNAYGFIKWKQANMGFEDYALDLGNPDFVKYIEAYGGKGYRVEKVDDLQKMLKASFKEKGVKLIECPIDYSENKKVLNEELDHLTCPI
jgi:acetolactate synthase-1/2/3 large subunit